ncbi:MAG: hypothetical protein IJZ79_02165 [Bacilli bacterium]|nr:hypothetical protein [Bacilli bacterium]
MLYLLKGKYFEEGYYEFPTVICGFTSGAIAKEIEYILKEYLTKYDADITSPNDYFEILKNNYEEIIQKFSKCLNSELKATQLWNKLRLYCREYPRDWKEYGPWFKAYEISEF